MLKKPSLFSLLAVASISVGIVGTVALPSKAAAPAAVTEAVQSAIDTVEELNGLSLAALTVALVPLGSMLTLRFLNMVLSRV